MRRLIQWLLSLVGFRSLQDQLASLGVFVLLQPGYVRKSVDAGETAGGCFEEPWGHYRLVLADDDDWSLQDLCRVTQLTADDVAQAYEAFCGLCSAFAGTRLVYEALVRSGIDTATASVVCAKLQPGERVSFSVLLVVVATLQWGSAGMRMAFLFSVFDAEGAERLSPSNVELLLSRITSNVLTDAETHELCDEIFDRLDTHGTGELLFEDFVRAFPTVSQILKLVHEQEQAAAAGPPAAAAGSRTSSQRTRSLDSDFDCQSVVSIEEDELPAAVRASPPPLRSIPPARLADRVGHLRGERSRGKLLLEKQPADDSESWASSLACASREARERSASMKSALNPAWATGKSPSVRIAQGAKDAVAKESSSQSWAASLRFSARGASELPPYAMNSTVFPPGSDEVYSIATDISLIRPAPAGEHLSDFDPGLSRKLTKLMHDHVSPANSFGEGKRAASQRPRLSMAHFSYAMDRPRDKPTAVAIKDDAAPPLLVDLVRELKRAAPTSDANESDELAPAKRTPFSLVCDSPRASVGQQRSTAVFLSEREPGTLGGSAALLGIAATQPPSSEEMKPESVT
ncbi:hypothetical protein DIPPA_12047 [Diplonema papillatum]|nr:hypothetical protein DIPPA_12047 [Diplonema papillatum]